MNFTVGTSARRLIMLAQNPAPLDMGRLGLSRKYPINASECELSEFMIGCEVSLRYPEFPSNDRSLGFERPA
jgi:hypothetical protein